MEIRELISKDALLNGAKDVIVSMRPRKAAYIIPTDDVELAISAIESASLTWGGADQLFVPYSDGINEDWARLMKNYDADLFVDLVGLTDDEKEPYERRGLSTVRWQPSQDSFFIPGALVYSAGLAFLDSSQRDNVRIIIPDIPQDHPFRLQLLARYGCLPDESNIGKTLSDHGFLATARLEQIMRVERVDLKDAGADVLTTLPASASGLDPTAARWRLPKFTRLGLTYRVPGRPLITPEHPQYELVNRSHAVPLIITGRDGSISDLCLYWSLCANRPVSDPFPLWLPLSILGTSQGAEHLERAITSARKQYKTGWAEEIIYLLSTSTDESEISSAVSIRRMQVVTHGFADFVPPGLGREGAREQRQVVFEGGHASLPHAGEEKLRQFGSLDWVTNEIEIAQFKFPRVASLRSKMWGNIWRITDRGFEYSFTAGHG